MRVILAASTVFAGMLATVAILSATGWIDSLPRPAMGFVISFVLFALLWAAMWLFNRKPLNLMGFKSPEDHLRELEAAGFVEKSDFVVTRAFEVEETEDEGLHYFLALDDGGVLYLTGQALYDFVEITDEPEFNQPRRFPCTEFSTLRHRIDRYLMDIQCRGRMIEPERVAPPFSREARRAKRVPEDGQVIRDRTFDEVMREFCEPRSRAV
jgi:hypothetical protein